MVFLGGRMQYAPTYSSTCITSVIHFCAQKRLRRNPQITAQPRFIMLLRLCFYSVCRRKGGFAEVYVEGRHRGVHALEFARGLQRAVAVDCEHEVGSGVVHQTVAFLPYMMLRFQQ